MTCLGGAIGTALIGWRHPPRPGTVRDVSTGASIDSVLIVLPGLRVTAYTDTAGAFTLANVPEGTHQWAVIRLGYVPLNQEMEVRDGDHFNIGVMPRPVELEGLTVTGDLADRLLLRRRRAAGRSVRRIEAAELASPGAATAAQLVRSRGFITACPAQTALSTLATECVLSRGRYQPVTVFIDEDRAMGGLTQLSAYLSMELHSVELWDHGTVVRVYTRAFISRLAQGRARLRPTGW